MLADMVVRRCAHCPKIEASHPIGEGDAWRVAHSQAAHQADLKCQRASPWLDADAA
jgi:hypothetical protein